MFKYVKIAAAAVLLTVISSAQAGGYRASGGGHPTVCAVKGYQQNITVHAVIKHNRPVIAFFTTKKWSGQICDYSSELKDRRVYTKANGETGVIENGKVSFYFNNKYYTLPLTIKQ